MWDLSLEKQTLLHERVRAAHTKTSHALGGNEPFQHKKRCSLSHGNNSSVPCEGICFSLWQLGFSHSPRVQCMSALGVFGFLLVSLLVRAPCHVHTAMCTQLPALHIWKGCSSSNKDPAFGLGSLDSPASLPCLVLVILGPYPLAEDFSLPQESWK